MTTKTAENKGGYKLKHLSTMQSVSTKTTHAIGEIFPNHVLTEEFVNPKTGEYLVIGQQFCFCS